MDLIRHDSYTIGNTHRTRQAGRRVPVLAIMLATTLACKGGGPANEDGTAADTPAVDTGAAAPGGASLPGVGGTPVQPGAPGPTPPQPGAPPGQPGATPGQPGAPPGQPGATPGQPGVPPTPSDTAAAAGTWIRGDLSVPRPGAGVALLRSVRTARQEGFDRIVLEFGSDAIPSYRISYIDRPVRQCGSGDVEPLRGDAWLEITIEPANAHTEAGAPTVTERRRRPDLPNILDLVLTCDFEAQVQWVAAVRSPERYRVLELRAPSRLVVDVRHPR